MLDKIQDNSQSIDNLSINQVQKIGLSNPYKADDKNFFIDESQISSAAYEKYQKELDIKTFSNILFEQDQKSANSLVIKQVFDELFSLDDSFLDDLIENKDFLDEINQKN